MDEQEEERIRKAYSEYRRKRRHLSDWSHENVGNRLIEAERRNVLKHQLQREDLWPLQDREILEVGCGSGGVLEMLLEMGATRECLYGIDLLPDCIEEAQRNHPTISLLQSNAEAIPFENDTFDLVFAFTVFSSILSDSMARSVADEIVRVLKPGGGLIWYDLRYDSPSNANVRGAGEREIRELFPRMEVRLQTLTVAPPLARRLGERSAWLYRWLRILPPLRTHYLGVLRSTSTTLREPTAS